MPFLFFPLWFIERATTSIVLRWQGRTHASCWLSDSNRGKWPWPCYWLLPWFKGHRSRSPLPSSSEKFNGCRMCFWPGSWIHVVRRNGQDGERRAASCTTHIYVTDRRQERRAQYTLSSAASCTLSIVTVLYHDCPWRSLLHRSICPSSHLHALICSMLRMPLWSLFTLRSSE